MQWRALVMLLVGISVIYLASYLPDSPHPQPTLITSLESTPLDRVPDEILLSVVGPFLYQTSFWFEASPAAEQTGMMHGVCPLKTGVIGIVQQRRRPIETHLTSNDVDASPEKNAWEDLFRHDLQGPMTKISQGPPNSYQFAVMYHVVDDEDVQHYVRVYYYQPDEDGFIYKDVLMPGTTWINAFSLEAGSILYSRDPDEYRFRVLNLPENIASPPHATVVDLRGMATPGDKVGVRHQPRKTERHNLILARLYSPVPETYRVFSTDVHKTPLQFYVNATIADGDMSINPVVWKKRDRITFTPGVYSSTTVQYMAFVDGTHFHQERTETKMPRAIYTRNEDGKTIVVPYIRNVFLTYDYTERVDLLQHNEDERPYLYRENGKILPEYYLLQDDELEPIDYYGTNDIAGLQINDRGNLLAVWSESDAIQIFTRLDPGGPHNRVSPLGWRLSMVVTPAEDELDESHISSVIFVTTTHEGSTRNFMMVAYQNQKISSYWLDNMVQPDRPDIWRFLLERWDMLIAMSMVLSIFVINESHRANVAA